jgi:bacillithiol biosynthesis deacetylase BshB1
MTLDVLVFAAHPDDAELAMGGTIARFANDGFNVGIVDLTRGEMGTRGNADTRQKEALEAAKILKTSIRENLLLPDGDIEISNGNIRKIVMLMRKYKPKIVFAPFYNDRHPDHIGASKLIKRAMFVSGLEKIKTSEGEITQRAYRPAKLFYYMQTYTFEPSFVVDISNFFEIKMKAVWAYSTQFHNPESNEPETFISSPEFIEYVDARAKFYGFQVGKKFGEPFYCEEKIELNLIGMFIL